MNQISLTSLSCYKLEQNQNMNTGNSESEKEI